jgi:hypothetical protein
MEDDCTICGDQLELGVLEITYCSFCGMNLHQTCLEKWETELGSQHQTVTCPLCRMEWNHPQNDHITRCPDLNAEALEVYHEFIYYHRISIGEDAFQDGDAQAKFYNLSELLLCSFELGKKLEDRKYCNAVLEAWLESMDDMDCFPSPGLVAIAYEHSNDSDPIRSVLIDIFSNISDESWFTAEKRAEYPMEFTWDLAMALLKRRGGPRRFILHKTKQLVYS